VNDLLERIGFFKNQNANLKQDNSAWQTRYEVAKQEQRNLSEKINQLYSEI
jgi:hypothetical protein